MLALLLLLLLFVEINKIIRHFSGEKWTKQFSQNTLVEEAINILIFRRIPQAPKRPSTLHFNW